MSTCKDLRRRHRSAVKAEREAHREVMAANARVVEATKKLAPSYVTHPSAQRERESVKPLVATAQAASDRWWRAADELSNLTAAVSSCKKRSR